MRTLQMGPLSARNGPDQFHFWNKARDLKVGLLSQEKIAAQSSGKTCSNGEQKKVKYKTSVWNV
jgi:hypothetical protein